MGYKIEVKKNNGDINLDIGNGVLFTPASHEDVNMRLGRGIFFIAFYDVTGQIVTPTAGTIKVEVSPIDGQWFESAGAPVIDATTAGAIAAYTPPVFDGPFTTGRLTFDGITGASYANAFFWRD